MSEKKTRTKKVPEPPHIIRDYGSKYKKSLPQVFFQVPETRQEAWDWYLKQIEVCEKCILYKTRNNTAKPDGTLGAKVLVIGDFPSYIDDLTGIYLTGPTTLKASKCSNCLRVNHCYQDHLVFDLKRYFKRKLLYETCKPNLRNESHLPEEFYMRSPGAIIDGILNQIEGGKYPRQSFIDYKFPDTNLVSPWIFVSPLLCRPYDPQTNTDSSPDNVKTPSTICKSWLHLLWAIIQPEVVIALGQVALASLIGKDPSLRKIPGEVIETKWGKIYYVESITSIMMERFVPMKGRKLAKVKECFINALKDIGEEINS